jgi:hypothetical protein
VVVERGKCAFLSSCSLEEAGDCPTNPDSLGHFENVALV